MFKVSSSNQKQSSQNAFAGEQLVDVLLNDKDLAMMLQMN